MSGTSGKGDGGLITLPRRLSQRIIRDIRHDVRGAGRKGAAIIPSAIVLVVEKWLGFWSAIFASAFTVGTLGMGLTYAAEAASTVPVLSHRIPWVIGHVWILGLLVLLTWGVMVFSLLLVSGVRVVLWSQRVFKEYWDQHTPPFSADGPEDNSAAWPPTDDERSIAVDRMRDFFGKGGIAFLSISLLVFLAEGIDSETLNELLSSPVVATIGSSLDLGFGIVNFDALLRSLASNTTQPQIVLFVLVFGIPGVVMSIGARNLLFLTEGVIRDHIETVREGTYFGRSTVLLVALLVYSTGVCVNILAQWG